MRFLFLFMDGIGFGEDDPETNPFAAAKLPNLTSLLGGQRLISGAAPLETGRATLLELDALRRQNAPTRWSILLG